MSCELFETQDWPASSYADDVNKKITQMSHAGKDVTKVSVLQTYANHTVVLVLKYKRVK